MTKTYARIASGIVMELFGTADDIADLFHPELVWVDITNMNPQPGENWAATQGVGGWTFSPPPPSESTLPQ